MNLARVAGTVVSAKMSETLSAGRYLLIEDCDERATGRGEFLVALDLTGAERGQLVLYAQGSSCRWTKETEDRPIDTLIVAIVDIIDTDGNTAYREAR